MERRTYSTRPSDIKRSWYLVDAEGKTLGRLATAIAEKLRGKHKATFAPHIDTGDFVVVVNAGKIRVTGNKDVEKMYYRHSNYPGGLKSVSLREQREKHPERILEAAVWGMLPQNNLGRQQLKKLKLYAGAEHPHAAQQPTELELDDTASRV